MKNQGGFTLIELITAITIMAILSSIGIASFVTYSRIQALSNSTQDVVTMLQLAKASATSQVKPSSCAPGPLTGYEVITSSNTNTFSIQPMCDNVGDNSARKTQELAPNIEFSAGNDVVFHTITGNVTYTDATIVVRHTQLPLMTKTITITQEGRVYVQ